MRERTTLLRLARAAAAELEREYQGPGFDAALVYMDAHRDAALELLDLIAEEAGRRSARPLLIDALIEMHGYGLQTLRLAAEAGDTKARTRLEAIRQRLLDIGRGSRFSAQVLLLVLRATNVAGVDPGEELRELAAELAGEAGAGGHHSFEDGDDGEARAAFGAMMVGPFAEIAADTGDNPFEFHAQIAETGLALPDNHRVAMAVTQLTSQVPIAREAALGWLLDRAPGVREGVADALANLAPRGMVSPTMLRRMMVLRPWLPESDHPALDHAIAACRGAGVDPEPWPQTAPAECFASLIDGSLAQNIFAITRQKRGSLAASLLLKGGYGVREGIAMPLANRTAVKGFKKQMEVLQPFAVDPAYLGVILADAVAENIAASTPPAFDLLQFAEMAGLRDLAASRFTGEDAMARLGAAAPAELRTPEMTEALLKLGGMLYPELALLDSWFQELTAADHVRLDAVPTRQRLSVMLDTILPPHLPAWRDRFALAAWLLWHAGPHDRWQPLFVAARELGAGRPIDRVPLMMFVAALTLRAYEDERAASRGPRRKR